MAVIAVKRLIDVLFQRHLTCSHHVTVILGDEDDLTVTSSYFLYRDPIEDHMRRWEKIIRDNNGRRLLLAGDVKVCSPQWYCQAYNWRGRGEKLEGLIVQYDLEICNAEWQLSTYRGNDPMVELVDVNVDLTVTKGDVQVVEWEVHDEGSSNHRLISYRVVEAGDRGDSGFMQERMELNRFLLRKANWRSFVVSSLKR